MSLVLLADAQARVGDSVTQDMIDGTEAWLASRPGMGPLTGERTETFFLSERRDLREVDGLWLSRRADSVDLTNDGDALVDGTDYRLINELLVQRIVLDGSVWGDTIVATYTPNDEAQVSEGIINLLTFASLPQNLQSVRIGAYSETYGTGGAMRTPVVAIVANFLPGVRLGRYASPFRYRAYREDRTLIEATGS